MAAKEWLNGKKVEVTNLGGYIVGRKIFFRESNWRRPLRTEWIFDPWVVAFEEMKRHESNNFIDMWAS